MTERTYSVLGYIKDCALSVIEIAELIKCDYIIGAK